MKNKLDEILLFLKENKNYNKALQTEYALGTIGSREDSFDKLVALLYDTINTQSQPNIDNVSEFFREVYSNKNQLNTFNGFFKFIVGNSIDEYPQTDIYNQLFESLKAKEGWGPKTSSLFIKNIYNYHHSFDKPELKFWNDTPKMKDGDKLYLPVDTVIMEIFNNFLANHKAKWNFGNINKILHGNFINEDVILFDDLWFWGFITQKGSSKRDFVINMDKYWTIKEADKDAMVLKNIEEQAGKFLTLLNTYK